MNAKIAYTAHSTPKKILSNFDLEKLVDTSDAWIESRTGIKQRYIVEDGEASSDISTRIAKKLLEKSEIQANDIDLIIVGTVTPDHYTPSTAALVQKNINANNAWGFDLSAACSGYIFGLETGSNFIRSGQYKNIMVIGVDTMSSILDFQDRDTCVIFGDGGGGAILQPTKEKYGIIDSILHMDGNGGDYLIVPAGGSRIPASIDSVKNRSHFIKQDGKTVFKYAVSEMANATEQIMIRNKLKSDDIKYLLPHQANKRIIDATAEKINLDKKKVLMNIEQYGNTTAATIPLLMYDYEDNFKEGDKLIIAAFGAGLTWGAAYLTWAI